MKGCRLVVGIDVQNEPLELWCYVANNLRIEG